MSSLERQKTDVQVITPDMLIPLKKAHLFLGTGRAKLNQLHAEGLLPIKRTGNDRWVSGRDWIGYVLSQDAPRQRGRSVSAPEDEGANAREGVEDATDA